MIDMQRIQKVILESTPVLERESVPILESVRRVLVQNITAVEDFPVSNISAMDGYAVRRISLNGARVQSPVRLEITGESAAGKPFGGSVENGQAVRIMTGGVVPEGADTVIRHENTSEDREHVLCFEAVCKGSGIRFKGESLKKGEVVLRAGDRITPLEVGVLASLRRAFVFVHRKPVVAVLSPGNELSDFHEPASPFKVMCSNLYALSAQVLETGGIPLCLGTVEDDLQALKSLLLEALRADVIITSGGTSKGKYDMVHQAFASLGLKMKFTNVFVKPGKPTVFGTIGKKLVFGLPGNPSATMLSFEQFIKPAILKMTGHQNGFTGLVNPDNRFDSIDSFNPVLGKNKDHSWAPLLPLRQISARSFCENH